MLHNNSSKNKLKIYKTKLKNIYIILSVLVFIGFSLVIPLSKAIKILFGIASIIIPTLFLMQKAFSSHGAKNSNKILGNFFIGEAIKIIFSIILLTVFFVLWYNDANFILTGFVIGVLTCVSTNSKIIILTGFVIGVLIVGISPVLVKIKKR